MNLSRRIKIQAPYTKETVAEVRVQLCADFELVARYEVTDADHPIVYGVLEHHHEKAGAKWTFDGAGKFYSDRKTAIREMIYSWLNQ